MSQTIRTMRTFARPDAEKHVFVRRMSSLWLLTEQEEEALHQELRPPVLLRRGHEVVADGAKILSVRVLSTGVACRYRMLAGGRRQIFAFLLPGDIIDSFSHVCDIADHSVSALSDCEVASIQLHAFRALIDAHPNLFFAMWRYCLSESSILQIWLTNMRRRSAAERLGHLFCEQFFRLHCVGLAEHGQPVRFNIAQADLADAAAMSPVHVNRTLQQLRRRNLIGRNPALLEILDWEGLREVAGFDPGYLHLLEPRTSREAAEYNRGEHAPPSMPHLPWWP
jgi:CRP-like cAMP-binding protein